MQTLAMKLTYACRKVRWVMPLLLFLISLVVAALGADDATAIIMSPIAFNLALELEFNPVLAPLVVWAGTTAGSWMPWLPYHPMMASYYGLTFGQDVGTRAFMNYSVQQLLIVTVVVVLAYVILKGWRTTNKSADIFNQKPKPLNKEQKITLWVIIVTAMLVLVPAIIEVICPNVVTAWMKSNVTIQVLAVLGTIVFVILRIGQFDTVLKERVPWSLIIMICGMGMLMGLTSQMGVTTLIGDFISSGAVPKALVIPGLFLVCAVLSFFVSGAVINPMLLPIAPLFVAMGVPGETIICAISTGLVASSLSPFSQGGALAISGCPTELKDKMATKQMTAAICIGVFVFLLSFVGVFGITV